MSYEKEYVKLHLGEPLTLALVEICLKRPKDPILYLAQWLLHWQRNKNKLLNRRKELELLLRERQKVVNMRMELEQVFQLEKGNEADKNTKPTLIEDPELKIESEYIPKKQKELDNILVRQDIVSRPENYEDISERKVFINPPIIEEDEDLVDKSSIIDKSLSNNDDSRRESIMQEDNSQ